MMHEKITQESQPVEVQKRYAGLKNFETVSLSLARAKKVGRSTFKSQIAGIRCLTQEITAIRS